MPGVVAALRDKKSLGLIFLWGWVVGPAFGYLITRILPLAEPFVVVVLLTSLAPCAPFLQQMVGKGRGDMAFAGAFIPLVAVGTVVLMPLMAPLLIKGLTISAWALAKPLLLDGAPAADDRRRDPALRGGGGDQDLPGGQDDRPALHAGDDRVLSLLYGKAMLDTAGSLALLSMTAVHGRDGNGHVSLRLRPETVPAIRHVAGDGHPEHCGRAGGRHGHSERGPPHRDDGRHVDLVVVVLAALGPASSPSGHCASSFPEVQLERRRRDGDRAPGIFARRIPGSSGAASRIAEGDGHDLPGFHRELTATLVTVLLGVTAVVGPPAAGGLLLYEVGTADLGLAAAGWAPGPRTPPPC